MSDVENIFLSADVPLLQVAQEWLAVPLGLEPMPDELDTDEEIGLRGRAVGTDGWLVYLVRRNGYAEVDPEPDEVQAFDRYPVEIEISCRAKDRSAGPAGVRSAGRGARRGADVAGARPGCLGCCASAWCWYGVLRGAGHCGRSRPGQVEAVDPQLRGTEYLVAALEEPVWRIDADELAVGLRDRWPAVRIGLGAVELLSRMS
jgi:hypothetical protein